MKVCGGGAQASSVPLLPTRYDAKNNEENFFHAPKLRQPVGAQRQRPDVGSDKNPTAVIGKVEMFRTESGKSELFRRRGYALDGKDPVISMA